MFFQYNDVMEMVFVDKLVPWNGFTTVIYLDILFVLYILMLYIYVYFLFIFILYLYLLLFIYIIYLIHVVKRRDNVPSRLLPIRQWPHGNSYTWALDVRVIYYAHELRSSYFCRI